MCIRDRGWGSRKQGLKLEGQKVGNEVLGEGDTKPPPRAGECGEVEGARFGKPRKQGCNHVFKAGGVQFLGLGYCTEQNTDGIPSFVHCSLLRNGNRTLHQKSWGDPSKFWGSGPPTPQWLRPCPKMANFYSLTHYSPVILIGNFNDFALTLGTTVFDHVRLKSQQGGWRQDRAGGSESPPATLHFNH